MRSIKHKMIIIIGILVFILSSGIVGVSYINSKSALVSNVSKTFPKIAEEVSNNMNARISKEFDMLSVMALDDTISNENSSKEDIVNEISNIIDSTSRGGEKDESVIDVAVITKDKEYIGLTDTKLSDFSDISFYEEALEGNNSVSSVIDNTKTEELVMVYAVPIRNEKGVIGALVKVKDGLALSDTISYFTLCKTGKAFIIQEDGTTIANGTTDLVINKDNVLERAKKDSEYESLAKIERKMIAGKSGYDVYNLKGEDYYLGYAPIRDTTWSAAILINQDEILVELSGLKKYSGILITIFSVVGLAVVYILAKNMSDRIKKASNQLVALSKGDLSINVIKDNSRFPDEVTVMINSMNNMHGYLRGMIGKIKSSSEEIDVQSETLSSISEEIATSSQSVAEAISQVTEGTTNQSESTAVILQILDDFSEKLLSMVNEVKDIDSNSREIGKKANGSSQDMDVVNESVRDISNSFKEFYTKIISLGKDINQVNEITSLINDIAEQTNLLALNAAIEAARAGEAGKGFSIVADEIRNLAEQTKTSSENIKKLIGKVSGNTEKIVQESVEIDDKLMKQVTNIDNSIQSFAEIIDGVDVIVPKIEKIRNSAEEINKQKEDIMHKVDDLSGSAMDISASSEEISASSQEMTSNTEEVAASAQVLNKSTSTMIEEVNKFIL